MWWTSSSRMTADETDWARRIEVVQELEGMSNFMEGRKRKKWERKRNGKERERSEKELEKKK